MLTKALRQSAKQLAMLVPPIKKLFYERDGLIACSSDVQQSFLDLASTFTPWQAIDVKKIRVGRRGDGGYIMVDDFVPVSAALSFGIETECSWDLDIATRGIEVFQFDHTVNGPPEVNPLFHFYKKMITGKRGENAEDLGSVLSLLPANNVSVILKCDIEGYEWEMFDQANIEDLGRLSQIVCEFHNFPKALNNDWRERALRVMTKLKTLFEVVHVHANNWDSVLPIANVSFPETLEVTFVNRSLYQFTNNIELFPTAIDYPNRPDRIDIFLGNFRFR